jgi:hypothetical protein
VLRPSSDRTRDRRNRFNETFLNDSPNALAAPLPKDADSASVVHVIDVAAASASSWTARSARRWRISTTGHKFEFRDQ